MVAAAFVLTRPVSNPQLHQQNYGMISRRLRTQSTKVETLPHKLAGHNKSKKNNHRADRINANTTNPTTVLKALTAILTTIVICYMIFVIVFNIAKIPKAVQAELVKKEQTTPEILKNIDLAGNHSKVFPNQLRASSTLEYFGWTTNLICVAHPRWFVLPHIFAAVAIEAMLVVIYCGRATVDKLLSPLLYATVAFVAGVWPNRFHIGYLSSDVAVWLNTVPLVVALLCVLVLHVNPRRRWALYLFTLMINSGPLGEMNMWTKRFTRMTPAA